MLANEANENGRVIMSITVARAMPIVKSQLHAKNSRKRVWCNVGHWEPLVSAVPVGPGDPDAPLPVNATPDGGRPRNAAVLTPSALDTVS